MTRPDQAAFGTAIFSAAAPIFGVLSQPLEWVISVVLSVVGSLIAVCIHEAARHRTDRAPRAAAEEAERRRQHLLDWEQRLVMREIELGRGAKPAPPAA